MIESNFEVNFKIDKNEASIVFDLVPALGFVIT